VRQLRGRPDAPTGGSAFGPVIQSTLDTGTQAMSSPRSPGWHRNRWPDEPPADGYPEMWAIAATSTRNWERAMGATTTVEVGGTGPVKYRFRADPTAAACSAAAR
jgi:hypothetical protein